MWRWYKRKDGGAVVALVVGILHAAVGEVSGLTTSLPNLPTSLVVAQVAAHIIAPPRGCFPAILARNLHACRVDVTLGVVTAFEWSVTAGTDVSAALLLDRFSSGAWRFDQDACCEGAGGRRKSSGGVEKTAVGADLWGKGIIIGLGGVWRRVGAIRVGISFERSRRGSDKAGHTFDCCCSRRSGSGTRQIHPRRGVGLGLLRESLRRQRPSPRGRASRASWGPPPARPSLGA